MRQYKCNGRTLNWYQFHLIGAINNSKIKMKLLLVVLFALILATAAMAEYQQGSVTGSTICARSRSGRTINVASRSTLQSLNADGGGKFIEHSLE